MTDLAYAPITAELRWFIGDTKIFRIGPITTDEDIETWTYKWQFRVDEPDADAILTKLDADITADNDTKCIDVTVNAEDTEGLSAINGVHALMRVDDNNEQVISYGPAVLRQSAVRKD